MTTSGPDIPTPSKTGGVAPGMPRRWWLTPPFLILAPAALSFAAWGFLYIRLRLGYEQALRENLTGFAIPATPSAKALLLLLLWYGAVASISALGWRLGSDKQPNHTVAALTGTARFRRYYFLLILTAAALGVGYSYYRIASTVSILSTLQGQTGNDSSDALSASASPPDTAVCDDSRCAARRLPVAQEGDWLAVCSRRDRPTGLERNDYVAFGIDDGRICLPFDVVG